LFRVSPYDIVGVVIEIRYLTGPDVVADYTVQEWRNGGKVEVKKVYEIFLPRDVYAAREAYR
jgi:hypothetical protein